MAKKKSKQLLKSFNEKQEEKKSIVLGTEEGKKSRLPLVIIVMCIVFLIIIGGYVFIQFEKPEAVASIKEIVHPVSLFEDGKARHFEHIDGNFTIKFFILKSSDGIIRAAFDACDVCWPAGKGYYQEGDYMVCRNCGRRFASVLVNEVKGGCNPAPLKRTLQDGKLIIQVKDILEGKQYFNFS